MTDGRDREEKRTRLVGRVLRSIVAFVLLATAAGLGSGVYLFLTCVPPYAFDA